MISEDCFTRNYWKDLLEDDLSGQCRDCGGGTVVEVLIIVRAYSCCVETVSEDGGDN